MYILYIPVNSFFRCRLMKIPLFHRLSIRTFLISINLLVLMLPIIGIGSLRIVENLLHRQTEAKLSAEAAYIETLYYMQLTEAMLRDGSGAGSPARLLTNAPPPVDDYWRPYVPTLDVSREKILPASPPGKAPSMPPHPAAVEAGKQLEPVLRQVQRFTLSGLRILDPNGVVVATNGDQYAEDLSDRPEVAEAMAGRYCAVLREREPLAPTAKAKLGPLGRASRVRVYVAIPMIEGNELWGIVYLHRTSLTFFRDLWEPHFMTAIILILVLTVAISLFLSYIVSRPLKSIINQAGRIAGGEPNVPLAVGGLAPAEAHQLSEALAAMVAKLKARMAYIEEFARSFSHEFKTPLAGIQGSIELLRENGQEMSEAERQRFLTIIAEDGRRMERLVKKLLELTRIETAEREDAETDLAKLLGLIVARYREAGHKVSLEKETESASARIASDLAETLFINLIDNAVAHGGEPISITLRPGPSVTVADRGPGISAANLPRIFDRFFTTARDRGGTGLGLSIVRAIADANAATINIESGGQGTAFTVNFNKPRA
jgi:signal transduction histidine kinase